MCISTLTIDLEWLLPVLTVSDPDSALNKGKLNEYKEAHMVLGELFPERFHTKVQNLPYYMVPQGPDSQAFF